MRIETAEFTIYEAEKLQNTLLELLNTANDIELDFSLVENIDMVGIQLLISLYHSIQSLNKTLTYTHINEEVYSQIALCHCEKAIGLQP